MSDEISKGVWWDSLAGKVVETEPTEGVQIIAPGLPVTPTLEAEVQRYRDVEAGVSNVGTVTTADVEAKPEEAEEKPKPAAKSKS